MTKDEFLILVRSTLSVIERAERKFGDDDFFVAFVAFKDRKYIQPWAHRTGSTATLDRVK